MLQHTLTISESRFNNFSGFNSTFILRTPYIDTDQYKSKPATTNTENDVVHKTEQYFFSKL